MTKATVTTTNSGTKAFNILINAFGDTMRRGSVLFEAREEGIDIAHDLAQDLRDSLYGQEFKMAPLSRRYKSYKKRKRLDPRTLIATKKYVEAIGVVHKDFGAIIGITKGYRLDKYTYKRGSRAGTTVVRRTPYHKLQRWLEYGTRKMPPRPHWRPAFRLWKQNRRIYGLRIKTRIGKVLMLKLKGLSK